MTPTATSASQALDAVPGVSVRLRRLATLASLTVLPSCVWRLAIAAGIPMGWGPGSDLHHSYYPGRESLVLVFVTLLQEGLGLLSLGLVRRWGEELPRWIPRLGGRRFHPLVAVVPAALGALALTAITCLGAVTWNEVNAANPDAPTGPALWIFNLSYAPLLLWGPLLGVLAVAYWRRRRVHG
ncbi:MULTISPECIES: hypothetical protein [Streptomyces]|uniref:Uncharacterized protein n=1 Tax=Streptomyces virginiae TaxID=1961 RepID=A0ABQ3NUK4_STRVG|nr:MULTISPECIES: hypothetical protein [Streptomyces]KOU94982.1 hypothetical protein ADK94_02580 [Streptomyces sp. XY593]MBP2345172.1 hypothetical protein [Streptomyces virginiae]GGP86678.1 hypothetical protein GCM10010215_10290 [Streptomyces virginiae]GHI16464.1 hypothetical protein Scinn_59270 [Streptomyces virginiae]